MNSSSLVACRAVTTPDPLAVSLNAARRAGAVGRAALRWMRSRTEWRWLIVLCMAVRLAAMLSSPAIEKDSVSLLRAAARVRVDGWSVLLDIPHHPLPVAVFSLAGRLFDPLISASVLCAIGSAVAVWPLHALARRACGRHAALATCLLYAALPMAVAIGAVPLAGGVALPFLLGALALTAGARDASRGATIRRLIGAGVCAGLAYLSRPEALVAFPAALAAATLDGRSGRWKRAGLVAAGFVLLAAPYVIGLSQARGRFSLSPKKDVARFIGVEEPIRTATQGASIAIPEAPAPDDSGGFVRMVRGTAGALESALTVPLALLVLLGAVPPRRWRRRRSRRPRLLLGGAALILIALVARLHSGWGYGGGRHAIAAAVLLLPFAGEGLAVLGSVLPRVTTRRRFLIVTSVLLAIPLGSRAILRPPGVGGVGARRLGEALAEQVERESGPGRRITVASAAEPLVAFYADRVLAQHGGGAQDVPLWGRFLRPLALGAPIDEVCAAVAAETRRTGAEWLVLDVMDGGAADIELLRALRARGTVSEKTIAAGSKLAAIAVTR